MDSSADMTAFSAGKKIACFGSRETPGPILTLMTQLGRVLVLHGAELASGHADGADWAFEQGAAQEKPEAFTVCLPWRRYNQALPIHPQAKVVCLAELTRPVQQNYLARAQVHHPGWHYLTPGGRLLHGRNMLIAEGARAGFCYLNHKKTGGGGSGQCYRVLRAANVPVWDLATTEGRAMAERIIFAAQKKSP